MTKAGRVYGEALYSLSREEASTGQVLEQLEILDGCFAREPGFLRLLDAPNLPKAERCRVLEDCFRDKVDPYILNFLKFLTEQGRIRHFSACVQTFTGLYNREHGILPVTAVTACPMSEEQTARLTDKLRQITGRRIALVSRTDPGCLGGMRLEYDGKCLDGTLAHRLDALRKHLKNTLL